MTLRIARGSTSAKSEVIIDVVVLCGGKGTRLGELTAEVPKPLLPVGGSPFLLRLLLRLKAEGFRRFILAAHHRADRFQTFLTEHARLIPGLQLVIEPEPLGTGGSLRHAAGYVRGSSFVALNGDTWVSQPIVPVLADHQRAKRVFTAVAVKAHRVEGGVLHKGVWRIGAGGKAQGFDPSESVSEGWVNAGLYVLEKDFVLSWPIGRHSLEENLPSLLKGRKTGVFCSSGSFLDIGTPRSYRLAQSLL